MAEETYQSLKTKEKLRRAEQLLEKSFEKIAEIKKEIHRLTVMYKRAKEQKNEAFQVNLNHRLLVVSGVRMRYSQYSCWKETEIDHLKIELRTQLALENSGRNLPRRA